jgi:hypothetical protein
VVMDARAMTSPDKPMPHVVSQASDSPSPVVGRRSSIEMFLHALGFQKGLPENAAPPGGAVAAPRLQTTTTLIDADEDDEYDKVAAILFDPKPTLSSPKHRT